MRSDIVMQGYLNLPDATRDVIVDGWLRTGDMGLLDDRGVLTLKDRSKDVIISGGSNIYPAELEAVLLQLPGVSDVAVVAKLWAENEYKNSIYGKDILIRNITI